MCGPCTPARFLLGNKFRRAPKTEQIVERTGNDADDRYDLSYGEDEGHHAQARTRLFVTRRFYGIQICRLPRGIDAEAKPNSGGGCKAEDRPEHRHASGQRRPERWNNSDDDRTEQNSNQSADRGKNNRLKRELQKNVALARANSFSNADLPRPLGV